jgi:hypothetical protein
MFILLPKTFIVGILPCIINQLNRLTSKPIQRNINSGWLAYHPKEKNQKATNSKALLVEYIVSLMN